RVMKKWQPAGRGAAFYRHYEQFRPPPRPIAPPRPTVNYNYTAPTRGPAASDAAAGLGGLVVLVLIVGGLVVLVKLSRRKPRPLSTNYGTGTLGEYYCDCVVNDPRRGVFL